MESDFKNVHSSGPMNWDFSFLEKSTPTLICICFKPWLKRMHTKYPGSVETGLLLCRMGTGFPFDFDSKKSHQRLVMVAVP